MEIQRRRTLISSFFITLLIGIAFKFSVGPIWGIFERTRISLSIEWLLPYIFILTAIRFFIGNQLHLLKLEESPNLLGWIWLFDFSFIFLESFILIFVGKSCSLSITLLGRKVFFFFIGVLLFLDVFWILLQGIFGLLNKKWVREIWPWAWGVLNFISGIVLIILAQGDILYKDSGIILMGILLTIAAIIDVFLIDYYGLLKKGE